MPEVAEDTWRAANDYVDRKQAEHIEAEFVEHPQPGAALAVREEHAQALALPVVSPLEAKAAMEKYFEVCEAVLREDDYQDFTQYDSKLKKKVTKKFKKKSAVKKLQTFWSVSVKIRDMQRDDLGDGHFGFRCIATASTPNGREVEASGGCSTYEERFEPARYDDESDAKYAARVKKALARSYHDVLSTAETRATNRAVMNCIGVGGGEVTADEISRDRRDPPRDDAPPPTPPATGPTIEDLLNRAKSLSLCTDKTTFAAWLRGNVTGCEAAGPGWKATADQKRAIIAELDYISEGLRQDDPEPAPPAESAPFDRRNEERRIFAICADPAKNAVGKKIDDDLRHQLMQQRYAQTSLTALNDGQLIDFGLWLEGKVQ